MSLRCIISRVLGGSSKSARLSHELSLSQTLAVKLGDENERLTENLHRSLAREVKVQNDRRDLLNVAGAVIYAARRTGRPGGSTKLTESLRELLAVVRRIEERAGFRQASLTLEEQEQKGCGR